MMRPTVIYLLIMLAYLAAGNSVLAACNPGQVVRDDVLIVVNDNSVVSPSIGDYYCSKRGIDPGNIAHVHAPATSDVQLDQFIVLRDQLIKFLLENTLPAGMQSANCDQSAGYTRYYCPATVDQIRQFTRIRYLVLTKGIPARFRFTGSTLAGNPDAVVDNYLRFWLLNYFDQDVIFTINHRAIEFADGRGMRSVYPATDKEFIVGRIEGIDAASSMKLVDRAIAAEQNGIFGKLYGSKFGRLASLNSPLGAYWKEWLVDGTTRAIYPSWGYLHGLFGNFNAPGNTAVGHSDNSECYTYDANGKAPQDCVTRLTSGSTDPVLPNDPPPATPWGRIARADNALVYQGYLDGFSSGTSFANLLNWRSTDNCSTICAANDATCKNASDDSYKEIDTRCVHLSEGFIGYNFNSYPVGMMASWPTGWFQSANSQSFKWDNTGSFSYNMWPPEIRNDIGYNDNFSLWYRNTDQQTTAACYLPTEDFLSQPGSNCSLAKKIYINQTVDIQERSVDLGNPQQITVRFKYRALDLNKDLDLRVNLYLHESVYSDQLITIGSNNQLSYGYTTAAALKAPVSPADGASWADGAATFALDPAKHRHPQYLFDGIKIRINSDGLFEGQLGIDNVTLDIDGVDIPLVNPGFDSGFQQLSGGDSAVTFLSRLNGTAFWGNISHHEAAGHSFDSHPYETLIYFLRGLPLGDAVWFAETRNSGILYGDPLYSPIAVHLHRLPGSGPPVPNDHFLITTTSLVLRGDALNGTGQNVTTTYSIDYCSGSDFLPCDQTNSWLPIANIQNQPGGARDLTLGSWDISSLAEGDYTLRLAVTSSNSSTSRGQTFYDYYPVTLFNQASDSDLDGLTYAQEISLGTDPWNTDTDTDGLPDGWEASNNLNPLVANGNTDSDSDGFSDFIEYLRQSNPIDANSIPPILIYEVDPDNGTDNGQTPFKTISAAITVAQAGDTISLTSGIHNDVAISLWKPIRLKGQADNSAIIKPSFISNNTIYDVNMENMTLQSPLLILYGPGLHFENTRFTGNTVVNSGASVSVTNSIFSGASQNAIDIKAGSSITLGNVTITRNETGIHADANSSVLINNSIIWGNTTLDVDGIPPSVVTYSLIGNPEFASTGGNIMANPQFENPASGNYHLHLDSPAIDAGDPASDYSREPVSVTGRINMGAYGNTPEAAADSDGDGIENRWELFHSLNPMQSSDAAHDNDADGLSNLEEYNARTDPNIADSDNDGVSDNQEIHTNGTDPNNRDTDSDGMPDGWELTNGLNPLASTDAKTDIDGDGYTNVSEFRAHSDPLNPDSIPGISPLPWIPLLLLQ